MLETGSVIDWLLSSSEPWTRYRTRIDLLGQKEDHPEVQVDRREMQSHSQVLGLMDEMQHWGELPFKRHNDAGYPIYKFSTLADFGFRANDPRIGDLCEKVMSHQSPEGAFQSVVNIPKSFGGSGEDLWTWMICDSPTLLYTLMAMGFRDDLRMQKALQHLTGLVDNNGYCCKVDGALGKFRGPGAKADPCPIANVMALKALSQTPELWNCSAVLNSAEMLLAHWAAEPGKKYYLFGAGSDYRKLKVPLVWYDILNVSDTLSRFPSFRSDPRLRGMVQVLLDQANSEGQYTASSMYQSWKGWSFADKKSPSPWLTFLVMRIQKRMNMATKENQPN
jgi:hypothetical protein